MVEVYHCRVTLKGKKTASAGTLNTEFAGLEFLSANIQSRLKLQAFADRYPVLPGCSLARKNVA